MAHDLQAPGPAAPSGGYSTRPLAPDRRIEGWTRAVSDRLRAHLHEPHLGIEELARRLALSPSYLHLLFRAEGTTPMRWLWHARLLRGRELLADPRHAHRSITEIAFDLGFSDAAHFSRSFKALFGAKPSECRSPARITS